MALFLTSQDVASLLDVDDYIETIEDAYKQFGMGESSMLPRIKVDARQRAGFLKILPAALSASGVAGIHTYTGGGQGNFLKQIFLYDLTSGNLEAIIESDRIGWLVPGAVSAVATRHLARKDAAVMALFGSGRQAQAQLLAMSRVCDLELVKVYSPHREHREAFCEALGRRLNLKVVPAASPGEALAEARIVSAATSASIPVFEGSKLEEGVHINAIGAHAPNRREVDGLCVQKSKVVVDSLDRAWQEEGALLMALEEGFIDRTRVFGELGEIVAGKKAARERNEEITLFLSGAVSIEYVAVGAEAYRRAGKKGVGQELSLKRDEGVPRSLYVKNKGVRF